MICEVTTQLGLGGSPGEIKAEDESRERVASLAIEESNNEKANLEKRRQIEELKARLKALEEETEPEGIEERQATVGK
jgi:hypothetical protein